LPSAAELDSADGYSTTDADDHRFDAPRDVRVLSDTGVPVADLDEIFKRCGHVCPIRMSPPAFTEDDDFSLDSASAFSDDDSDEEPSVAAFDIRHLSSLRVAADSVDSVLPLPSTPSPLPSSDAGSLYRLRAVDSPIVREGLPAGEGIPAEPPKLLNPNSGRSGAGLFDNCGDKANRNYGSRIRLWVGRKRNEKVAAVGAEAPA
jgi:hypothetical protein